MPYSVTRIAKNLTKYDSPRILLLGESGVGKSTLAKQLAQQCTGKFSAIYCMGADLSCPAFGIPGAVCLGLWSDDHWHLQAYEAVCSLDAARFRLPLLMAINTLLKNKAQGLLIIDTPGLVNGIAASEFMPALVAMIEVDILLVLQHVGQALPLTDECQSCNVEFIAMLAHKNACKINKTRRLQQRWDLWQAYLKKPAAIEQEMTLAQLQVLGTSPPLDKPEAWQGRQIALGIDGSTQQMGQVIKLQDGLVKLLLAGPVANAKQLLIRDAFCDSQGRLKTAMPHSRMAAVKMPAPPLHFPAPIKACNRGGVADESLLASGCFSPGNIQGSIICRVGPVDASLVNGVFGDPLLHLRFRDQKRGLLFDLGASGRIPARLIHQITDVFISHCHIDHIGGFFWLLRARIGDYPKCRLYGPPGLAEHINGMVNGVLWDRAGDKAPRFEVSELHKNKLHTWAVTAGVKKPKFLHCKETEHGILLNEATFCVRATTLDHGVPVLAFSFEPARQFKVQKEAIKKLGLTPGPWLQKLKHCLLLNDPKIRTQTTIRVSNGQIFSAEQLAEKILKTAEAQKLAYATDFADTPDNHRRLARLADHAQIFFCEASFLNKDIEKAQRTGHLTTSACGRIATEAHVAQLIPFHFSRRYETDPATVYSQIQAVCSQTRLPDVNEMH